MMELYEGGWLDMINAVDLALQSQAANADAQHLWSQSEAMIRGTGEHL
ncbi:MAG TPA: hypothetical protein VMV04_21240 [Thermodesulfobacteriota bacterium]|nr:hypothetical protein [Thermodesulfobacteriota bacterium]